MTGIIGLRSRQEADTGLNLAQGLDSMNDRGSTNRSAVVKSSTHFLAIGSRSFPGEEALEIDPERVSFVIDGLLPENLESEEIGGEPSQESLAETLSVPYPLALIAISRGRLIVARDALGQKPLYYGVDKHGTIIVASLRRPISAAGMRQIKPVPPGRLLSLSEKGITTLADNSLSKPKELKVPEDDAKLRLRALLVESLSNETSKDLALAFSGGLDSSLVARAAQENDLKPELISVGMKGQAELEHARKISKHLGLGITIRELSESEVVESLPDVVGIIESADPVLVGVSVPLYFACVVSQEMGADCLLAGQLSDELFAGYGRFDALARKKDAKMARDEVWKSVRAASSNDFEPGDKLAVSHGLRLRCPFAFLPLAKYALQLPIALKLRVKSDQVIRKYILRRLAAHWDLTSAVADRPKKAVQYSTGVQKVLLKEAKRQKITVGRLLESFLDS